MTVVLVDWHWSGHHPTFFSHYVLALEQLGLRVLAFCSRPEEARSMVAALRESLAPGADGARVDFLEIPQIRTSRLLPSRLRALESAVKRFVGIERLARKHRERHRGARMVLFYACMYDWDFAIFHYVRPLLRMPWYGLYLRVSPEQSPRSEQRRLSPHVDRIFDGSKLRGVAILDESAQSMFAARIRRPVVVFPDLTDQRMPSHRHEGEIANELESFAGGRPVVGLFGHLQRSKGVVTFCSVAADPALSHLCFALGGEIDWLSFTPDERTALQQNLADSPSIWSHFARIPDEPAFNELLVACHVIFAAYLNFPHSSNMLTKAAFLEKPIIVSEGTLMAERVRRFSIGEVVPEGDATATAAALVRITRDPDAWAAEHKPDWEGYRSRHSFPALTHAFAQLLGADRTGPNGRAR